MSLSSRPGHHGPKKLQQGCVPTSSLSSPPRPSGPPLACTPPSAQVTFTLLPPVGPSLPRTQREGRGSAGGHRCPAPGAWPRWAAAPVRPGAVAVSRRPRTYCRCLESAARASACAGTAGSAGSCPSGRSPRTRGQIPRSSPACSLGGGRQTDRSLCGGEEGQGEPTPHSPEGLGEVGGPRSFQQGPDCTRERGPGTAGGVLTELLVPLGRNLEDHPLDDQVQVAEEDERGRRGGPAVVLLYEVVPLELPDLVRVLLHLLERVAGRRQGARVTGGPAGPPESPAAPPWAGAGGGRPMKSKHTAPRRAVPSADGDQPRGSELPGSRGQKDEDLDFRRYKPCSRTKQGRGLLRRGQCPGI